MFRKTFYYLKQIRVKIVMAKTTKADFKLFKRECEKWIDIFGLHGYEFRYSHENSEESDTLADVVWETVHRSSHIVLYENWPDCYEKDDYQIRLCAFHEVFHVFIGKLSNLAKARYIKEREVEEEEHAIIRTLERVLFPKY